MKKTLILVTAAAAIIPSCSKEFSTADNMTGSPVSFVANFEPQETKITLGEKTGTAIPVYWESGDAFGLHTVNPDICVENGNVKNKENTWCGAFTTSQGGSSSATFSGVIPEGGYGTDLGVAIFPFNMIKESRKADNMAYISGSAQIGSTVVIPDVQDGSGLKYMVAAARLKNGVLGNFSPLTCMMKMNLASEDKVKWIDVSLTGAIDKTGLCGDYNMYISKGDDATSFTVSSAPTCSLRVEKEGEFLSGDVYFTTRAANIAKNTTGTLSFTFHYGDNGEKTKSMTQTLNPGDMKNGRLYDYGTVTMKTLVSYGASLPTHSTYTFPYRSGSGTGASPYVYHGADGTEYSSYKDFSAALLATNGGIIDWTVGKHIFTFHTTKSTSSYFAISQTSRAIQMDEGTYVELPDIAGKKLISVYLEINNSATYSKSIKICNKDDDFTPVSGGEAFTMNKDTPHTFMLSGTTAGTRYCIKETNTKNMQITKIVLTYKSVD